MAEEPTKKAPAKDTALKARVEKLEQDQKELSWYFAELYYKHTQLIELLTAAAAQQMAQQIQPQVNDALQAKLAEQLKSQLTGAGFATG